MLYKKLANILPANCRKADTQDAQKASQKASPSGNKLVVPANQDAGMRSDRKAAEEVDSERGETRFDDTRPSDSLDRVLGICLGQLFG